jgi:hypothetical protein
LIPSDALEGRLPKTIADSIATASEHGTVSKEDIDAINRVVRLQLGL